MPGSTWFRIVQDSCRAAGFEPDVGFSSDDYRGVQAFAAAGLGVAVVPGLAVAAGQVPGHPGAPAAGRRSVPAGAGGPAARRVPDLREPADDGDARDR